MTLGLLARRVLSICREKAKTTGPARALANNANPTNGGQRFHGRFIAVSGCCRQDAFAAFRVALLAELQQVGFD
ncbi:hypothetical protein [Arvimicrobium flavum]|uniref:hypothetical protein n=1 Tax=Arvimicrobium flavum TaxID=3393320 RepID=UPI00237A1A38|nr:hypothetical protein [Mesorhizobium shangrilense]